MIKIITGTNNQDLETKLNAEANLIRVHALSGFTAVCEIFVPPSNPKAVVTVHKEFPSGETEVISREFDKDGNMTKDEKKNYDAEGKVKEAKAEEAAAKNAVP